MSYKIIKQTIRKYYKTWVQPVLSSNGTMGGSSPAASSSSEHVSGNYAAWKAFDGITHSAGGDDAWANNNVAPPQWIMFYNPTPFQLQSVTIENRYHRWLAYTIQGSNDGSTFTDIESFIPATTADWGTFSNTIATARQGMYKYYRFYVTQTSTGTGCDVGAIEMHAVTEGSSTDYDTYEDVDEYKLISIPQGSTTTTYNVTTVGSLTNTNGVLSGFSSSNYAIIPYTPNGTINSFELVIKFTTSSDVSTYQTPLGQVYTNKHAPQICAPNSVTGKPISVHFPLGNGNWDSMYPSYRPLPNTTYWVKMVYDGTYDRGYYSTDGSVYNLIGETANSYGILWDEVACLGNDEGKSSAFMGSIDLNECYIKINNIKVWEGATTTQDYNYRLINKVQPVQEDIYMSDNTTMVLKQGLQMPLYTDTDTGTYTLPDDIVLTDLLTIDTGTLSNSDVYTYYPSFEEQDYNTSLTSSLVKSGNIVLDGYTYRDTYSDSRQTSLLQTYWAPYAFKNENYDFASTSYPLQMYWGDQQPLYVTTVCENLTPGDSYIINNDFFFLKRNISSTLEPLKNITIIIHTDPDFSNSAGVISRQDNLTMRLNSYSTTFVGMNSVKFTIPQSGKFYVSLLFNCNGNNSDNYWNYWSVYRLKGYARKVISLFNTSLGIDLTAMNWSGEGTPNDIQISFRSLEYGSSQYKYLITVQSDGSAVITNNPDYQPT